MALWAVFHATVAGGPQAVARRKVRSWRRRGPHFYFLENRKV